MHLCEQQLVYQCQSNSQLLLSGPAVYDCEMQPHVSPLEVYCHSALRILSQTDRPGSFTIHLLLNSGLLVKSLPKGQSRPTHLYSTLLYTYDCTPSHPSNTIIKFANGTTVVGLISGGMSQPIGTR